MDLFDLTADRNVYQARLFNLCSFEELFWIKFTVSIDDDDILSCEPLLYFFLRVTVTSLAHPEAYSYLLSNAGVIVAPDDIFFLFHALEFLLPSCNLIFLFRIDRVLLVFTRLFYQSKFSFSARMCLRIS